MKNSYDQEIINSINSIKSLIGAGKQTVGGHKKSILYVNVIIDGCLNINIHDNENKLKFASDSLKRGAISMNQLERQTKFLAASDSIKSVIDYIKNPAKKEIAIKYLNIASEEVRHMMLNQSSYCSSPKPSAPPTGKSMTLEPPNHALPKLS